MTDLEFVVRGSTAEDRPQVADLDARCFAPLDDYLDYDRVYDVALNHLPRYPGFEPEQYRVGVLGDKIISAAWVAPYAMYYGRSTLNVGGVGGVCTNEAHRKKGYADAVMRDALTYMGRTGCDISLLHSGPPRYYLRFGYANAWSFRMMRYELWMLKQIDRDKAAGVTVRDITPDDYPAMLALYDRDYRGRPAARVRTTEHFAWRLSWDYPYQRAAVGADGRLLGYAAGWAWNNLGEIVAVNEAATAALLLDQLDASTRAEGEIAGNYQIWWLAPPDAPAAQYARWLCPVSFIDYVRPRADWVGRVVNLQSTLQKLLPELEARVAASPCAGWTGALRLETDMGAATLAFDAGKPSLKDGSAPADHVARLGQGDLISLMFAFAPFDSLAAHAGLALDDAAAGLLRALFPERVSHLAYIDEF